MKHADSLYSIFRSMIREEIDRTPGFRELTLESGLPASIEAEKAILGAVMLDNGAMKELSALALEDFSLHSHRLIFAKMRELTTIDGVTLLNAFGEKGIKEIGGAAYLTSLTEGLPRLPRVGEYVAIVQEKAKLRRIMGACSEAIKQCSDQRETAAEIVGQLGVNLKGIKRGNGK